MRLWRVFLFLLKPFIFVVGCVGALISELGAAVEYVEWNKQRRKVQK